MDLGLKDRNVIVAAASDGIARAAAEKFAAEGARVAICSRDARKLNAAAAQIRERTSAQVLAEPFDVTDEKAVEAFVKHVAQEFGGVDVCVTNAGGPPAKMFFATTTEEWHRALEMNFMSTIHFARAVLPWMQKNHWGRLVTITSMTVRQPVPDLIYSNAVRAGVVGLVKSLSNEYAPYNVLVNNVCPGYTATERLKKLEVHPEAQIPLGRVGTPEEFANLVAFLASERASYITGVSIPVDGGWTKGL